MKKFLSAAVAFGLVAGVAATASALELKVKGSYKADGYWIDGASSTGTMPSENASDADWYQHTFRFDPTLIVNDKVQLKSDIRLVDSNSVWGSQDDLARFDGEGVRINKLWLVYNSPIGKIEVGRRPAGAWQHAFVNSGTAADRIMWWAPTSGPFKAYAFLQKSTERDAYVDTVDSDGPFNSGQDNDYYEVAGGYQQDNVKGWLGIGTAQDELTDNSMWRIKGYGHFGMNDMMFLGEFDFKGGDKADVDYNSYAVLLAMTMKMGNINLMAGYATISGDNDLTDDENNAYDAKKGTGADFEPLYILTGNRANVLNGDRGSDTVGDAVRQAGVQALVATADYKVNEDLTLHGGLGWGWADAEPTGWNDEYGWEADLGLSYKLYQNLTYDLHFGYWFVGDFADMGGANVADDVMLLSHHLTMKF